MMRPTVRLDECAKNRSFTDEFKLKLDGKVKIVKRLSFDKYLRGRVRS